MSQLQVAESGNISCYPISTDLVGVTATDGVLVVSFVRPAKENIVGYQYTSTDLGISFVDDFDIEQIQGGEGAPKISSDAIFQVNLETQLDTVEVDWIEGIDPLNSDEDLIDNYVLDIYELLASSDEFQGRNDPESMEDFLSKRMFHVTATHSYDKGSRGFITKPESASAFIRKRHHKNESLSINVLQKGVSVFIARPEIKKNKKITSKHTIDDKETTATFDYIYRNSSIALYKIDAGADDLGQENNAVNISDDNTTEYQLQSEIELQVAEANDDDDAEPSLKDIIKIESYDVEEKLDNAIDTNAIYGLRLTHNYKYDNSNGDGREPDETNIKLNSNIVYFKWTIEQENVAPTMFWAKRLPPEAVPSGNSELLMVYLSAPKEEFRWYNGKDAGDGTLVDDADPTTAEDNLFTYQKAWIQVTTFDPLTLQEENFDIEAELERLEQEEKEESRILIKEKSDDGKYYMLLLKDMPENMYSAKLIFEYRNDGVIYKTKPVETIVLRDGIDPEVKVNFDWNIVPTHKGYNAKIKVPPKLSKGQIYFEELDSEKRISNANGLANYIVEYRDIDGTWEAVTPKGTDNLLELEVDIPTATSDELADITIPRQHRIKYKYLKDEDQEGSQWYYSEEWQYLPTNYPPPYNLFVAVDEENENYIVGFDRSWLHSELPNESYSTQEGVILPKYSLEYKLPSEEEYSTYEITSTTRATDNGSSLSIEVDIPFDDLEIDLTKNHIFKLYNMYNDNNKDKEEIKSLPATLVFSLAPEPKKEPVMIGLMVQESAKEIIISFYRSLFDDDEIDDTQWNPEEVPKILPLEYKLNQYQIDFEMPDGTLNEFYFDEEVTDGLTKVVNGETGHMYIKYAIDKENASDVPNLPQTNIVCQGFLDYDIYSIKDGQRDQAVRNMISPPSRFYKQIPAQESMSYIFDGELENVKHPKVGKWDISNMIGSGNGNLEIKVEHKEIGTDPNIKNYTYFTLTLTELGEIDDDGNGSVYTAAEELGESHTLVVDEYEDVTLPDGSTEREVLDYLGFEVELIPYIEPEEVN